jgi:seryl-tRNA synthetase
VIDLRLIRESPDTVRRALERRSAAYGSVVDDLLEFDGRRRSLLQEVETLKAERNRASEEVARLKRDQRDASSLITRLKGVSAAIRELDSDLRSVEDALHAQLLQLPNLPDADVPDGDEGANIVVRSWGEVPVRGSTARS